VIGKRKRADEVDGVDGPSKKTKVDGQEIADGDAIDLDADDDVEIL
jgi:hypothetical protein